MEATLGGRRNGFKLIKWHMKSRTVRNFAQSKLFPASQCSFNHQNLEIIDIIDQLHVAFNYKFVLMISSQHRIGIFSDPGCS